MKIRPLIVTMAAAAALSVAVQVPASATAGSDALYTTVSELAGQLNSIAWPGQWDSNFYPGAKDKPEVATTVVWGTPGDPSSYVSEAKCAALVTAALEHTFGWATELYLQQQFLPNPPSAAIPGVSPTAADYYAGFVAGHGAGHFSTKTTVPALAPGDLIAIKYPAGSSDTGHMMIVAQPPSHPAANEWAVQVIDSTSNPHGVASTASNSPYLSYPDTRASGTTEYSGIGRGWIIIDTDATGVPTGYRWGVNESTTYAVSDRPMIFEAIL
jgi:hypothetical protein